MVFNVSASPKFIKLDLLVRENNHGIAPKYYLTYSRPHPPSILNWIMSCGPPLTISHKNLVIEYFV